MQAFVIEYKTGVRVIVHTANLIRIDFDNKTQGMWWQDFPRKVRTPLSAALSAERRTHVEHPAYLEHPANDDGPNGHVTSDGGIAKNLHIRAGAE